MYESESRANVPELSVPTVVRPASVVSPGSVEVAARRASKRPLVQKRLVPYARSSVLMLSDEVEVVAQDAPLNERRVPFVEPESLTLERLPRFSLVISERYPAPL